MRISAVVVTRNEEKNIEKCLRSLSFAGEIIIVDSNSTDNTLKICRKYGCRIYTREFTDFSSVKNYGIERARGKWALSIDADEEVTSGLRDRILKIIGSEGAADGYHIKRSTFFLGKRIKHSGWGKKDFQLRLFKKSRGRFEGIIHEKVKIKGRTAKVNELINHYSYPDVSTYFRKMNRYTTLQAIEKKKSFIPIRLVFDPVIVFVSMFIIKKGFLDGLHGFILAVFSGFSEFVKLAKMAARRKQGGTGIVIRMPSWIGDCVIATALLEEAKRIFKKVHIICPKAVMPLFTENPGVDSVSADRGVFANAGAVKKYNPECVVSLKPALSSHLSLFMSGVQKRCGYANDAGNIFLRETFKPSENRFSSHVMEEYKSILYLASTEFDFKHIKQHIAVDNDKEERLLKRIGIRQSAFGIVVSPFSAFGPSKQWPVENYEELAEKLLKKYKKARIFITGSAKEKKIKFRHKKSGVKDLRGASIGETIYLIKNSKFFIGNDSGLAHIADAFNVPSVVIYGSTSPVWAGALNKTTKNIYKGISCQPCYEKKCRYKHYKCLKEVGVGEVVKLISK